MSTKMQMPARPHLITDTADVTKMPLGVAAAICKAEIVIIARWKEKCRQAEIDDLRRRLEKLEADS